MKKVIIIPLLALGLMACQANTEEEPVEKETNELNESNENEEVKEGKSFKEVFEKADLELYNEVIDDYASFSEMTREEAESANFQHVKGGAFGLFYDMGIVEGFSIAYYDINDDGVEELLVGLRASEDYYHLIDLYTIMDGEIHSVFTDELSSGIMLKRSGNTLLENGDIVYTSSNAQGELFGDHYELQEDMEYEITYQVTVEEGDPTVLEQELANSLDLEKLDWEKIGKEKEVTAYENFINGDYSLLEGVWENGYEGSLVKIEGSEVIYSDDGRDTIDFINDYSDEDVSVFNLTPEDLVGGALLYFYPIGKEIEFGDEIIPSDTNKARFFITQSDPPEEDWIYYQVSGAED